MIINRDETFNVVCNIRTPNGEGENVGTGVFIEKDNNAYLVTASHVAVETTKDSYIVICDQYSNPISIRLTYLDNSLNWKYHKVEDLAVMKIDLSKNIHMLQNRCFPYSQIEFNNLKISRDDELTCVGFPRGLGALGNFSPFTFRSYASSNLITLNRADTQTSADFFCLENPSVGGYSGGPVFDLGIMIVGNMTSTKSATRLLGIMHGTLYDTTGGKLALVTPALYLKDLI